MPYLTFEELRALAAEVEAIMNFHHLAPMSDDSNNGEALTPGYLIIGSPSVALPEEPVMEYQHRRPTCSSRRQSLTTSMAVSSSNKLYTWF